MEIKDVKTATKVGEISKVYNNPKKFWTVEWDGKLYNKIKDSRGRVYLIVVNGKINKIGGSADKNGLKGTFSWYENNALSGGPSVRTHGIHLLINEELINGSKVELYMISSEKVKTKVKGLFGKIEKETNIDFKEIENLCKEEYFNLEGTYPKWNFQENNQQWGIDIVKSCNLVNEMSALKRKTTT